MDSYISMFNIPYHLRRHSEKIEPIISDESYKLITNNKIQL